jgi:hypothetical protein
MKKNLNTYKNKSGFKIPENYMQDFETNLFDRMELDLAIHKENPAGYMVPDTYFANFNERILAKINTEKQITKVIPLFSSKRFYYAAGVAAVFIAIISTVLFKSPTTSSLNNVEYAALEDYLNEEDLDLNYNEISNLLYEDGVIIESLNASTFSDEDILDYLNENVEDSGLIIE